MDFILLDWTRMGRVYCLAGAIVQVGQYRIVRPLPGRAKDSPTPNNGWSPFLMDGHSRWEVFELVGPTPACTVAPHLEDVWVQSLRPRRSRRPSFSPPRTPTTPRIRKRPHRLKRL